MRILAPLLFVLSLCVLVFVGTIAMMHFKFFPYPLVRMALTAGAALWDVETADQINFLRLDEEGKSEPHVAFAPGYEDDGGLILTAGGPGALVSECPQFGCLAWVMNRQGKVLHTWEADMGALWADSPHDGVMDHNKMAVSGAHLFDNGDLVVSVGSRSLFPYGVGMVKFDADGEVIWKKANFAHHWFTVAPDGTIYTPAHEIAESPLHLGNTPNSLSCGGGPIYSDVVLKVSPDGETLETVPLIDRLIDAGLVGLLTDNADNCDPLHLNHVEYVTAELADGVPGLREGDLVVSLRQLDMIAVLDAETRAVKWYTIGRTIDQHSPRLAPGGEIFVFDNYGGDKSLGGSRVVALTHGTRQVRDIYPRETGPGAAGDEFFSGYAGVLDLGPHYRRALVSVTDQGRILEIDLQTGDVLWEYVNNHDLGSYPLRIGEDKEGVASRLWTDGAWYVGRPSFLAGQAPAPAPVDSVPASDR